MNCEEGMREKNEMGVVGEKKKERQGIHEWKGKKKEIKKKKEMGSGEWGLRACGKKRGSGKERRKKI